MSRICDNCHRPVLDSDTVCWHCGWKLSPIIPEPGEEEAASDKEEAQAETLQSTPIPLTIYYGGLTILIIMALIWLMNSLAKNPTIVQLGPESSEFVLVQDPLRRFTISIPDNWEWIWEKDLTGDPAAASFIEDTRLLDQAGEPLGSLVADNEQVFLAGNDSTFLLIMASERLNKLTGEQIVSSLSQETFKDVLVENARQAQNSAGEMVALFDVNHDVPPIHCRQLWSPGTITAYLVSACTAAADAREFQNDIDITLNSFRIGNQ